MTLTFAKATKSAIPLTLLAADQLADWLNTQTKPVRNWVKASGFDAKIGAALAIPDADGNVVMALAGFGSEAARRRGRFALAAAASRLPDGVYDLNADLPQQQLEQECLGWLLSQYRFETYCANAPHGARLVAPAGIDAHRVEVIAAGEALTRDLINTPASDMGPDALEAAARVLAKTHKATLNVITGDDLLSQNFPMIHAVGRAASRAPRLLDMRWGTAGPTLTLVGKGVCFDTGGLNLKPGASMGLMKKDMGGAATVMGLASMIMALGIKVQLRMLIPAVENAVSGNAFRPGDILTSRKGLTVEINNTDAEGRLVLADALALADADKPDAIISMATLTGAARVAVGPDLAPYYATQDTAAAALEAGAEQVGDPVWRMPFWDPYEPMIEPGIADLDNAPSGGFAGSITAALFLRRFVTETPNYIHFDIYGWQPTPAPARPKGGVGMGARALLAALPGLFGK